jgi:hypothetical protein
VTAKKYKQLLDDRKALDKEIKQAEAEILKKCPVGLVVEEYDFHKFVGDVDSAIGMGITIQYGWQSVQKAYEQECEHNGHMFDTEVKKRILFEEV